MKSFLMLLVVSLGATLAGCQPQAPDPGNGEAPVDTNTSWVIPADGPNTG